LLQTVRSVYQKTSWNQTTVPSGFYLVDFGGLSAFGGKVHHFVTEDPACGLRFYI